MQQATFGFACQATKNLADMAAEMPKLKAFVHVSTAYVNGNQPKGASVSEHLLPLDGEGADHASLVAQLQALPKAQAASQVSAVTTERCSAPWPSHHNISKQRHVALSCWFLATSCKLHQPCACLAGVCLFSFVFMLVMFGRICPLWIGPLWGESAKNFLLLRALQIVNDVKLLH